MGSPIISQQKILAAAQGDSDALRDVLNQLSTVNATTQAAIGTTPTTAPVAGQPNPAAPVPPQATGSVSLLAGNYIVQIVNPGATNPISQLQSQQAAGNATFLSPVQPVKAIYHQIRASTSPAFNVNSNTQTFGGNTGSAQVYWSLTGLGSGTWYFQFRSSYDGINFNTWRNANSGTALGGLINQVTEENVGDANWALFALPGSLITGIGAGFCENGAIFDLAEQVYSSGLFAIAGPNGFTYQTNGLYGPLKCDLDLQAPTTPPVGTPDYPVIVSMLNAVFGGTATSAGSASVFGIALDPTSTNATFYKQGTTAWASVRLPGGATIAIGVGQGADGSSIWTPPTLTWIDPSRMMSICSLTGVSASGNTVEGYFLNQLNALAIEAQMMDATSGLGVSCSANWLAIAWQDGTDVQTIGGFPWLAINLQGGHAMYIGAGQVASGTAITLPGGCTALNMLSVCTPASSVHAGNSMAGVQECAFQGLTPVLVYNDNGHGHFWGGNVNWMAAAWI